MRRIPARRASVGMLVLAALGLPACMKKTVVAPVLAPQCQVSPSALSFGSTRVGDCARTLSFTITNEGEGTLTGIVPDTCGAFAVTSGSGRFSLVPGLTRTVVVEFCPRTAGEASCELSLGSGVTCGAVRCTGTGTRRDPVCAVSPLTLPFGEQVTGACSVAQAFTIGNTGGDTLTGTVPTACGPFTVTSGSGAFRLAAGQSRTVAVKFCPTATGPASCDLALGGNVSCAAVGCSGTGTTLPPSCEVTPLSLPFGEQTTGGCSGAQTITVTNTGQGTLSGSVPAACGVFTVVSGSGAFSLGAGQSRSVGVAFCPTGTGPASCDLVLDVNASCPAVACSGTGTPPPLCQVSPASLAFGDMNVGSCTDTAAFAITNAGGGLLTGTVPAACGPYVVTSGAGAFSLSAGASRLVAVQFCPTGSDFVSCDLALGGNVTCPSVPCYGVGHCVDTVTVTSRPAGAAITVDGTATGEVTPHSFSLAPGTHTFSVRRNGVSYFAPTDTTLNVPCRGTLGCEFVGHHRTTATANLTTWIDQTAPAQNHCTDPVMVVSQDSVGGHTAGAMIRAFAGISAATVIYRAYLTVHEIDSGLTPANLDVSAYPIDQDWTACAPTWDEPGVTWSAGPPSPTISLGGSPSWRTFDVTAAVARWAAGIGTPQGWILLPARLPSRTAVHRFDSVNSANSSYLPSLQIDWIDP